MSALAPHGRGRRLRAMCAVLIGAYVVHQLRYLLAYRSGAADALAVQGHAYLAQVLCPLIGSMLALAMGHALWSLARPVPESRRRVRGLGLIVPAAAALLGIYAVQELLEGALATGHPVGLDGVLGAGGWLAVPLSLVAGFVVALLIVQVDAAADRARYRMRVPIRLTPLRVVLAPLTRAAHRDLCIGCHIAGRAPPLPTL